MLELRAAGREGAAHARMPGIVAELQAGFELLVEFAVAAGTMTAEESGYLRKRAPEALAAVAAAQVAYQENSDPALRFHSLLRLAIASGRAHCADRDGKAPDQPERWGWTKSGGNWTPAGVRIGWVDDHDLYLDSALAYRVAQELAGAERLPLSERTLRARLKERGLLASTDPARETLKVRRMVLGEGREVLNLSAGEFQKQTT